MKPTQRFSDRVADYLAYRLRYPQGLIGWLQRECSLKREHIVADVGSGTGFLAELFLANGNTVIGLEPNAEMREAGDAYLRMYPHFGSVDATAEDTGLQDASVDFVVAGQAWHWFETQPAVREFKRICRPDGWVVLAWNARRLDSTPFLRDYERVLMEYSVDYSESNHQVHNNIVLENAFRLPLRTHMIYNVQMFDLDGLLGRAFSSSYTPALGHAKHAPMKAALTALFERHQHNGQVAFEYDCFIYAINARS